MSKKVRELSNEIMNLKHRMRWEEDLNLWAKMDGQLYDLRIELEEEVLRDKREKK